MINHVSDEAMATLQMIPSRTNDPRKIIKISTSVVNVNTTELHFIIAMTAFQHKMKNKKIPHCRNTSKIKKYTTLSEHFKNKKNTTVGTLQKSRKYHTVGTLQKSKINGKERQNRYP